MQLNNIELIELNEAFACQSLVIREAKLDPSIINVNGGAIALGHPQVVPSKLTVQLINEMKRRKQKYGMVTTCRNRTRAAGIIEIIK